MKKRAIDMTKDPRHEQFEYFASLTDPYAGVTCQVDITAFMERLAQSGAPFFLAFTYEVLAAANAVPELRRRIEGDRVVEYDACRCSCTVAKPDGSYAYCTLDGTLPWAEYLAQGRKALDAARDGGTMREDGDSGEYFFISCVPWLRYTDMKQPLPEPAFSNVRLAWGKYATENGRTTLPVTLVAHHALADGIHLGAFYQELEKRVSQNQ